MIIMQILQDIEGSFFCTKLIQKLILNLYKFGTRHQIVNILVK